MTANDFSTLGDRTARSPLGRHLDWHCESITLDRARFRMPFAAHNVTVGDMVHGGAIAALADAAATAACWASESVTPASRGATVALTMNYLQAALGVDLIAEARVARRGGSLCVADVEVSDPQGQVVALARATYKLSHGTRSA
ncbi:MAG: PaaI family thioesterase [Pseudomonadales bacterium]|nr:PaaI family thioesterase [Pseudomonadales bacterium]